MDQLQRYRGFMRQLDVTDPAASIRDGAYVPQPGSTVADRIVSTATLRPYASQVLVGGIGAGKSTQLLVARDQIKKTVPDTWALYVDVSERHRLEELTPGVLVALAALEIGRRLPKERKERVRAGVLMKSSGPVCDAWERITEWAFGREADPTDDYDPDDSDPYGFVPGLLRPKAPLDQAIKERLGDVRTLRDALPAERRHVLMLFDSLDRVSDVGTFAHVVEQDLRGLRGLDIGVVMTAPLQAMFGAKRAELDRFDEILHQFAIDAANDPEGRAFLVEVLRRRAPEGLLGDEVCGSLAAASGGVLRDLIALARSAAEQAYMHGCDTIGLEHVAGAVDRFGRKLVFGLSVDEIGRLKDVSDTGHFVPTNDEDLALLVTRRVLEHHEKFTYYSVHPTLVPLLQMWVRAA